MKKLLFAAVLAGGFVLASCGGDKCLECSFTDPTTNQVVMLDSAACGESEALDALEALFRAEAEAANATDFECSRN